LEEIIRAAGMLFLSRQEIEAKWKGAYALTDAVQLLRDTGRVIPVGEDGLMHQEAFDLCLARLDGLFARSPRITVSDFKEACGLTRKHAIPLLELMDAEKVTARVENSREKGPDFSRWRNSRR
jgi:selenocysteine-specific elongation factor